MLVNASTANSEGLSSLLSAIETLNRREKLPIAGVHWLSNRLTLGRAFPWSAVLFTAKNKHTGRYRPLAPGQTLMPDERRIGRLKGPDALLVKALSLRLSEILDPSFSEHSYAYRQGAKNQGVALRSFYDQVFLAKKYPYVAKLDVRDFFGSIPHDRLFQTLRSQALPPLWLELIEGFLSHSSSSGLLQGSPLSGVLSNLTLHSFDQALETAGIPFLRYADDITLLAKTPDELEAQIQRAQRELESLGLSVNEGKTLRFTTLPETNKNSKYLDRFEFLGFEFTRKGTYAIREKTLLRAKKRIQRLFLGAGQIRPHRSPGSTLKEAIHRFHLFVGFERHDDERRTKKYRLSRPSRSGLYGWVRYWTALPHSPRIDAQLQALHLEVVRTLRPFSRPLKKNLRSAVSAYRTLTAAQKKPQAGT